MDAWFAGSLPFVHHFLPMKKIGEILLDTGVLVVGDLISLKRMKQTPHQAVRQFMHSQSQQVYTQGLDFQKFTDLLLDGLSVNDLIEKGVLVERKQTNDTELSSENILNDLEAGFKQIKFENGASGKALAVLSEEGFFPVYAETDERGISKLVIDLRAEQE
jgi:hypothetical protein